MVPESVFRYSASRCIWCFSTVIMLCRRCLEIRYLLIFYNTAFRVLVAQVKLCTPVFDLLHNWMAWTVEVLRGDAGIHQVPPCLRLVVDPQKKKSQDKLCPHCTGVRALEALLLNASDAMEHLGCVRQVLTTKSVCRGVASLPQLLRWRVFAVLQLHLHVLAAGHDVRQRCHQVRIPNLLHSIVQRHGTLHAGLRSHYIAKIEVAECSEDVPRSVQERKVVGCSAKLLHRSLQFAVRRVKEPECLVQVCLHGQRDLVRTLQHNVLRKRQHILCISIFLQELLCAGKVKISRYQLYMIRLVELLPQPQHEHTCLLSRFSVPVQQKLSTLLLGFIEEGSNRAADTLPIRGAHRECIDTSDGCIHERDELIKSRL
ncbi:TAX-1 [Leishmania tarentolae]|uniref:TAX-1 n=1 Tax=Leishmania tarentolae TaxID=5689 RepID=A0A640KZK6_LEITA|nr:TAX-1 [Leishmania tarentolae]